MRAVFFIMVIVAVLMCTTVTFVRAGQDSVQTSPPEDAETASPQIKDRNWKDFWRAEPARDAVLLGLWSTHFSSDKDYRTRHNLVGVQYQGYFLATFANSYSRQIVAAGAARTVFSKDLGGEWRLDAGYKIGPMYGYREGVPNIGGFSVLPLGSFGLTCRRIGIDLNLVPGNALSVNFRVEF